MQGVRVESLVEELRSRMLSCAVKKKNLTSTLTLPITQALCSLSLELGL